MQIVIDIPKEVKSRIAFGITYKEDIQILADAIDNGTSLPKGHCWIPVSERLPEDFQRVLVTIVNYNGDKVVRVAVYHDKKKFFKIKENHEEWEVGEKGLLAWMPLPEPYEPKESEDKE